MALGTSAREIMEYAWRACVHVSCRWCMRSFMQIQWYLVCPFQFSPPVHDDDNYDDYLDSCCLLRGGFRNTDDSTINRWPDEARILLYLAIVSFFLFSRMWHISRTYIHMLHIFYTVSFDRWWCRQCPGSPLISDIPALPGWRVEDVISPLFDSSIGVMDPLQ